MGKNYDNKQGFGQHSIFKNGVFFRGFLISASNPQKEKFAVRDAYKLIKTQYQKFFSVGEDDIDKEFE